MYIFPNNRQEAIDRVAYVHMFSIFPSNRQAAIDTVAYCTFSCSSQ